MGPKSSTLFHFTKNSNTLELILKTGFWPRYSLEDIGWLGYSKNEYMAYPMVCFCDIPLSRISEHVEFYGNYGLGMSKEWAQTKGLNPVNYIVKNNNLKDTFRGIDTLATKFNDEGLKKELWSYYRRLVAFTKPTTGNMLVDGNLIQKDFYQESEWRFIPMHENVKTHLRRSTFEETNNIIEANEMTQKHCMLKIEPKDIKYIFVKTDNDIANIINFIQKELDNYPGVDLKILMSRVVSLESLQKDI